MFALEALYLFIPAIIANMSPGFAKALRLPGDTPISSKLFGDHKTWRGHIASIVGGIFAAFILHLVYLAADGRWITGNYADRWLALGVTMAVGAKLGDTFKSFVKRHRHLEPGAPWFPWDQIDYLLGAIPLSMFVTGWVGWKEYTTVIVSALITHKPLAIFAYLTGQKSVAH